MADDDPVALAEDALADVDSETNVESGGDGIVLVEVPYGAVPNSVTKSLEDVGFEVEGSMHYRTYSVLAASF